MYNNVKRRLAVDSRLRGNDSFSSSWVCDALIFAHLLITTLSADWLWIPAFAGMTAFLLMGVCDALIFARKLIPKRNPNPLDSRPSTERC